MRISDIAKDMGISVATVSNALAGKGRMRSEVREAIRARAAELGSRSRHRRPALRLVAVTEELNSAFVSAMLSGAVEEASAQGLLLPVCSLQVNAGASVPEPDIGTLNRRVEEILASLPFQVSGVLYISQYARRVDGLLTRLPIPTVSTYCTREDGGCFVHYDDHQGAYLAVNALLDGGCRNIAMISGPINSIGMYLRSSGYQQALVERGLLYDPQLVRIGDWDSQSGYEQTARLLESSPIDGIFAQNDYLALGAVRAVREKGLSIPEDVSVVGFDDTIPARLSDPQLSSIRPPFQEMGRQAVRLLLEQAAGAPVSACPLLPCTLVQRQSIRSL